MRFRKRKHEVPGLNTTSTADISFMLLIFFLVTTSMDVDKGLLRQLPAPTPEKQEQQTTVVDKKNLMALHLTAENQILVNDSAIKIERLQQEALLFMKQVGKKHLISLESDREADYDLYFQIQNRLMSAYNEWRNDYAQQHFGKSYARLSNEDKDKVKEACPQRITESYANANKIAEDNRMKADDTDAAKTAEKGGEE